MDKRSQLLVDTEMYRSKFICLTETAAHEMSLACLTIEGFTLTANYCRETMKSGGASIWMRADINVTSIDFLRDTLLSFNLVNRVTTPTRIWATVATPLIDHIYTNSSDCGAAAMTQTSTISDNKLVYFDTGVQGVTESGTNGGSSVLKRTFDDASCMQFIDDLSMED